MIPDSPSVLRDGVLSEDEKTLAFLAHELRTPLAGIGRLMDLLRDGSCGEMEEAQRSVVDLVRRNVAHLECVVAEFLDFAALETGTLHLRPRTVPLRPAVMEVVSLLRPGAETLGVHIACRVEPQNACVRLDPTRFREVLFNLLGNAVRHSPAGGRVDVRLHVDDAGLHLVVGDQGEGIDAARRSRLFQSFEGDGGGSGLGLSVVQGIVEAQGGAVSVHEGSPGAVFRVRIPHARF